MTGTSLNAAFFLIGILFDSYIIVLIVRLVLALVHTDDNNRLNQLAVKLTNPIIKPLKKVIPNVRRLETSTLLVILLLEALKFIFKCFSSFGAPNILGLLILSFGDSLRLLLHTWSFAILIQAIISWVNPQSPFYGDIKQLTYPIMRPLQKIIPSVSGIDISPILAIILLELLVIIMIQPMLGLGWAIAVGT